MRKWVRGFAYSRCDGSSASTSSAIIASAAARPTKTLYDKLGRHGIKPKQFRQR